MESIDCKDDQVRLRKISLVLVLTIEEGEPMLKKTQILHAASRTFSSLRKVKIK